MRTLVSILVTLVLVFFGIWIVFRVGGALLRMTRGATGEVQEEIQETDAEEAAEEEIEDEPQPGEPTPTPSTVRGRLRTAIRTVLRERNYERLRVDMADSVTFRIVGSKCCGTIPADEAVRKLAFLEAGDTSWNLNGTKAKKIKSFDPSRYAEALVYISTDSMVASFWLDGSEKISEIEIAADDDDIAPDN